MPKAISLDDLKVIASVGPVDLTRLKEHADITRQLEELSIETRRLLEANPDADISQLLADYRNLAGRSMLLKQQIRQELIATSTK